MMQNDKTAHEMLKQQVHDMAKFPEENPNPVLRMGGAGEVLFANAAARALAGLLENNGSRLAHRLGAEVAAAHAARQNRELEFASGERLFNFVVTPVPGETYVNLYGREITEERKAQQNTRDVAKFPEENPNPVLRVGGTGEVLFANAAARALPGLIENGGNRLAQDLGTAATAAYAARQSHELEFASGERLFAFALNPVSGETYVNLYGREITEERRAQQKTRDMAKFPEENPNPVLRVSGTGEVLFANAAARGLAGLLEDDGRRLANAMESAVAEAFAARENRGVEFVSGELLFAFVLTPVPGEFYVNLYGREITEERRAHLAVLRIKNSNQNILNNLTNGILTFDSSLDVTSANPAVHRILGLTAGEVVGRSVTDLVGANNSWLPQAIAECQDETQPVLWLNRELLTASGLRKSANFTLIPLRGEEDASTHMLILEDITREKHVKSTMARFMSEHVVERLLDVDDTILGGSAQEASILFSDIRNFTALFSGLDVREMVADLNEYFSMMVDVIFEHTGTLDKFIGDALMAVFGAPFVTADDPDNAVRAGTAMLHRLRLFNSERTAGGRPLIDIGIGIDTGSVIAGTVGSPKRMDYTVIGEHVNLAARIESANKYYGTHLLISEDTKQKLNLSCTIREIDMVQVQGVDKPIRLYEVLDYHTEETFPNLGRVLDAFADGVNYYRQRQWPKAAEAFGHALVLNPSDRPTQIFLSRCWAYLARSPGRNWSGVTDLSS
jgi:PAS domain S-box-containing protein